MRAVIVRLIFILLLTPGAAASGRVDAGLGELWVDDRYGYDCSHPIAGACFFNVTKNDGTVQNLELDTYQSIYFVGVATNFSAIEERLGEHWLLPDESVTVKGEALYVRYPFLRIATETWQNASEPVPRNGKYWLGMSSENVTLYYYSNYPSHPTEFRNRNLSPGYANKSQGEDGVGYESVGPIHAFESDTTDSYLRQALTLTCKYRETDGGCRNTAYGLMNHTYALTPNVQFGLDFYDMQVATDPSHLGSRHGGSQLSGPLDEWWRKSDNASRPMRQAGMPPTTTAPVNPPPRLPDSRPAFLPREKAPTGSLEAKGESPEGPDNDHLGLIAAAAATAASLLILAAILYSRFATRAELLRLENRRRLLDLIEESPGISVSEAARRLDVAPNTVRHHLRMLARMKLVRITVAQGETMLHRAGSPSCDAALKVPARFWSHPIRSRIKAALEAAPEGLSRQDIHGLLPDVPVRTRNHTLKVLIENELVEERAADGTVKLRLAA